MLYDEIVLTPQDILEKEFKLDTRGYRPQEVDKYLDLVIKDYAKLFAKIKSLEGEKKELVEENLQLKQENRTLNANMAVVKTGSNDKTTNVDVLRRLSQLEKIVYGEEE